MMNTTDFTHEQTLQRLNDMSASQKEGLEKLLTLAEDLHRKVDGAQQSIARWRIAQVAATLFAISVIIFVYKLPPIGGGMIDTVRFTTMVVVCLFYPVIPQYFIRKDKRRKSQDSAALAEVVELLREVEPALTKAENWSYLDKVQFRIRLARLGIGHSTLKDLFDASA